jgi:hypothetical protein
MQCPVNDALGARAVTLVLLIAAIAMSVAAGQAANAAAGLVTDSLSDATIGDAVTSSSFSYLYIEANEGDSSGGHVGIRFGDSVYHFQNQGGLLVLDRVDAEAFVHGYTLVANRDIHVSRVAVAPDDRARLQAAFAQRMQQQGRQLEVLASLDADLRLLEVWSRAAAASHNEPPTTDIPALGYFSMVDSLGEQGSGPSDAIVSLRTRIDERYGAGFLAGRRAEGIARLDELARSDPAAWEAQPPSTPDEGPPFASGWARRYADVASGIAALEVLARGAGLRPDALIEPSGPAYTLERGEIDRLERETTLLEARLVRLAGSARADWGVPFLVGLARLEGVRESLRRGRWVVLDVIPRDAARVPGRVLAGRRDLAMEVVAAGHADAARLRRAWLIDRAAGEIAWARIENAISRTHEMEQSLVHERDLRWSRGMLLPLRPAPLALTLPRQNDPDRVAHDLERVRSRHERYAEALQSIHGYELIRHNCVSEVFHTLNHALGDSVEASHRVLGGHVDGREALSFVPFISAAAVAHEYRVVERRVTPSFRNRELAHMRGQENDLWVALRESNTLTAQSYRRGAADSFFLFFTEAAPLLRPPLGLLNLVASIGESLFGLTRLPTDGGATIASGLGGGLMSLPELVFFNIRKGSNDWIDPRAHSSSRD